MDGELPTGSAAHGEAADDDAIVVDGVTFLHVGERFEEIDLAGEFVGIAIATVEMEDESVGRSEFTGRLQAVVNEFEFGEFLVTAVKPGVEPARAVG